MAASARADSSKMRRRQYKPALREEEKKFSEDVIKGIVYGGMDGILTAFAIASGAAGGNLVPAVVILIGSSNIIADAMSMGIGDVISTLAHNDHVAEERRREEWELENYPEGEIQEMAELYAAKGLDPAKAARAVEIMSQYPDFFVSVMMFEELGLTAEDSPYRSGLFTFLSFLFWGTVPLLGYLLAPLLWPTATPELLFEAAVVLTTVALFVLGAFKSTFSEVSWIRGGIEFMLLGGAVSTTSYVLGVLVAQLTERYFSDGAV